MNLRLLPLLAIAVAAAGLVAAACGGSSSPAAPAATAGEANAAASGDIPDNQVFLTFDDTAAGYSLQYPEGWAQQGSGADVAFRDKNNAIHVVVSAGSLPTVADVKAQLHAPGATVQTTSLPSGAAIAAVYTTQSAPNSVTGKSVTLVVDRYYVGKGGKLAVVDLATPRGVDNVDAYRQIIQSFAWK